MEQKLKERLVGASVLVAAAVIFLPVIFTDSPKTEVISGSNIPKKPETNFNSRIIPVIKNDNKASLTTVEPKNIEVKISNKKDSSANEQTVVARKVVSTKKDKTEEAAREQIKSTIDVETKAALGLSAWIVQLGSFIEEDNAQSLNKKLREAGYPAFVEPLNENGKISYRVRVGPEIKRSEADLMLKKMKEKIKLDGIVVSYP